MKHMKAMAILGLIVSFEAVQAASTSIDLQLSRRLDNGDTSSSVGTIAITTLNEGNPGAATQSMLYTVTGLTLDSVGTADDQITFEMGLAGSSSSGTVVGMGASYGAWGIADGSGSASLIENDEALTFGFVAATVTLGAGAFESASVSFDGFTGFSALNVAAGETFNISGTAANNVTGASIASNGDLYSFTGSESAFTVEGNEGAMRYNLVQASVTINTVPEPSASVLIALAGISLILRRRK
ncbi:PEP-CTERM sorting domain-containing protein [Verrucomicrobiaceae bacterium N1E253]|uniref:PEP-CTERM sorting domain-containing protein n=1 Tax=Oceaniferula marina TaxID=2748318 RepID=A0A851GF84_9BACT|nr:PEP-CTERM sorting domain-containing protein [Oceaniferula marina]NWK55859.1 PEP-CTERM sorting domain-containing protein [Oceaniferula marina]